LFAAYETQKQEQNGKFNFTEPSKCFHWRHSRKYQASASFETAGVHIIIKLYTKKGRKKRP